MNWERFGRNFEIAFAVTGFIVLAAALLGGFLKALEYARVWIG